MIPGFMMIKRQESSGKRVSSRFTASIIVYRGALRSTMR
jgi:hypothetical protein